MKGRSSSACSMDQLLFASAGACFHFSLLIALMSLLELSHTEKLCKSARGYFFVKKRRSKRCSSCALVSLSDSQPTVSLIGMFNNKHAEIRTTCFSKISLSGGDNVKNTFKALR